MNAFSSLNGWNQVLDRIRLVFVPDNMAGAAWGISSKAGLTIYKGGIPKVRLVPFDAPLPFISIYKWGRDGTICLDSWREYIDGCWVSETGRQESLEDMVNLIEILCREVFTST